MTFSSSRCYPWLGNKEEKKKDKNSHSLLLFLLFSSSSLILFPSGSCQGRKKLKDPLTLSLSSSRALLSPLLPLLHSRPAPLSSPYKLFSLFFPRISLSLLFSRARAHVIWPLSSNCWKGESRSSTLFSTLIFHILLILKLYAYICFPALPLLLFFLLFFLI